MTGDEKAAAFGFAVGVVAGLATLAIAYRASRESLIVGTRNRIVSSALAGIPAQYGPLAQALTVPGTATWVADQVAATMREKLP